MKKISIIIFAALLIACEKEVEEVEPITIVGKWQLSEQIQIGADTVTYQRDRSWEFQTNGIAIDKREDTTLNWTYSISGDSLYLDHDSAANTWRRRFELEANKLEIHTLYSSNFGLFFYGIERYDRVR